MTSGTTFYPAGSLDRPGKHHGIYTFNISAAPKLNCIAIPWLKKTSTVLLPSQENQGILRCSPNAAAANLASLESLGGAPSDKVSQEWRTVCSLDEREAL